MKHRTFSVLCTPSILTRLALFAALGATVAGCGGDDSMVDPGTAASAGAGDEGVGAVEPGASANASDHADPAGPSLELPEAVALEEQDIDVAGDAFDGDEPTALPLASETPLVLKFSTPPVAGLTNVKFAKAVAYGSSSQQVIDAFLPSSRKPTGVVFYFHGGGFTSGSRTQAYAGSASALKQVLAAGIAWIGVDYRLLAPAGVEKEGVRKSLGDSARAVQFVRRWASVFNIRTDRVGFYGTSAGAGTGLWLAYHPDLAKPKSSDPVARQSTRGNAVSAVSTQATYDTLSWPSDVFGKYPYFTNDVYLAVPQAREMTVRFYGLPGSLVGSASKIQAELRKANYVAYRRDVDMLGLLSSDDPPTYVFNADSDSPPYSPSFDPLHHPLHALAVDRRGAAVKVTVEADIPAYGLSSPETPIGFLTKRLGDGAP